MFHFLLYSRSYCHLCQDMLDQLRAQLGDVTHEIEVLDVDAHPALLEKYDELVPVLVVQEIVAGVVQRREQICHYHLDSIKLRAFIDGEH